MVIGLMLTLAACSFSHLLEMPEPVVLRVETGDGALKAHDRVALRSGDVVKVYEASDEDGGILKAAASETPFLWKAAGERKQISGWFRGDGGNVKEIPSEWAVAGDQDADEGAGLRQSDFLYASPTGITYTDCFHARINFYHQTSKVLVRIRNAGALKDNAGALEGLTVGDESFPVVMRAAFEEIPSDRYGRWTLSRRKGNLGYVKPHETAAENPAAYLKYSVPVLGYDSRDHTAHLSTNCIQQYYYTPHIYRSQYQWGRL